ncbi:glycosyltransferase [Leptolyngbyaceae cyanobacterium JSC-12]|nr:glycosyltransferase [Leptolyngbyaceae cyanobacterium JSC-12]
MDKTVPKVAFLLHNVDSGGVERVVVNLLKQLVKYPILLELVVFEKQGNFLNEVPSGVKVVELINPNTSGRLRRIFPLIRYLRREKPSVLVSQLVQFNVIAAIAKVLSGISLRLILVEHLSFDSLEGQLKHNFNERIGILNLLRRIFYPKADMVAAVSQGLATELEEHLRMSSGSIKVLYNPVIDQELIAKSQAFVSHPYFGSNCPFTFLAAGRLAPQKDFLTLIHAFANLRQRYLARLIILGEGSERQKLEAAIAQLNLESDVFLLGFTDNPYAYMSKANVFVLSSRFEALPTVLIEALACGCQVISTDCPHGPDEILMSGKYGRLVPVGDIQALANAMEQTINSSVNLDLTKSRLQMFSVEKAVSEYMEAMNLTCYSTQSSFGQDYFSVAPNFYYSHVHR